MTAKTVFCVLAFRGPARRLDEGRLIQFGSEDQARESAGQLEGRVAGYVVLRVRGDPDIGCWDDLEELARYGEAPAIAA